MAETKQPWQKISSDTVYDNPWIRVEDHLAVNPAGSKSQYGKICFKNRPVTILAVDHQHYLYLVGQHRYTLDEYSWELPMGGAPLSERPMGAAQRELREETGLTAKVWLELMHLHTSNSVTDESGFVYLARDLAKGAPDPEDIEDLSVMKLPLQEAVDWVFQGKITDAMSAAGILRLAADSDNLLA